MQYRVETEHSVFYLDLKRKKFIREFTNEHTKKPQTEQAFFYNLTGLQIGQQLVFLLPSTEPKSSTKTFLTSNVRRIEQLDEATLSS